MYRGWLFAQRHRRADFLGRNGQNQHWWELARGFTREWKIERACERSRAGTRRLHWCDHTGISGRERGDADSGCTGGSARNATCTHSFPIQLELPERIRLSEAKHMRPRRSDRGPAEHIDIDIERRKLVVRGSSEQLLPLPYRCVSENGWTRSRALCRPCHSLGGWPEIGRA